MDMTFQNIIGITVLVGLTYLSKDEEVLKQVQFFGTITQADEKNGITINKADINEVIYLPPDLRSLFIAEPGEYRLRSTEDAIVNPDLLTTWTIKNP